MARKAKTRKPASEPKRKTHSLELKLRVLQELNDGAAVTDVCRAFGVAYTTVMMWRKAYASGGYEALFPQRPGMKKADTSKEDARRDAVLALKRAHPEYGTRRIRDVLMRFEAIGISETEVRRMLHESGLLERAKPAPRPPPPERRFERAEPNQLWQSDIFTFLLRRHERIYLTAFMDDHSRFIVSHAMARQQKSALVMEALEKGFAKYGPPREMLTDNGRQYTTWRGTTEFEEELRRQGVRHIKSRPQHPQTLGKIERFWKTLWDECLSRTVFADYEDCERRIGLYIGGYNFQRPHQALQGLVPADRYFRAAPQVRAAVEAAVEENAVRLSQEQPLQKPFYIVGQLGDQEMSIAAGRDGLRVQLGREAPQTIKLPKEESDERAQTSRSLPEDEPAAPGAADAEVAPEEAGAGRDRPAADLDDPERLEWGEAGDGRDRGGADLTGPLLRVGGAGAESDPGGDGAGSIGWETAGDDDAAVATGGASEAARGWEAKAGEAATADAEGAAAGPAEDESGWTGAPAQTIGERWQGRFARLDADEDDGPRERLTDLVERGEHPLTWPRKLAGADALADAPAHEQELHAGAAGAAGADAADEGGGAGDDWSEDGVGGSGGAGTLAEPLPDGDAPGDAGADRGAAAGTGWPACGAGEGEGSAEAAGEAGERERAAAAESGDDRPADGSGERDLARAGKDTVEAKEEEQGGAGQ
jgi:transposase InsO family protein